MRSPGVTSRPPPTSGSEPARPAFVGREAELAAVLNAVSAQPALVLLEGEPGIGKSRLVQELTDALHEAQDGRWSGHVLVGTCPRIREPFPLAPLIDALRGLRTHRDQLQAAQLSPVVGALRPLLPEIADLLPSEPSPLDDRAAERHQVFRGLVELCASLGPTVLVLEDLHWADDQTIEFLPYLLADVPPLLSIVLTFRGDQVPPSVRAAIAKVSAGGARARRTEVSLGPLDADQTGTLAASLLHAERVSQKFAAHLCHRASGVPLAIEELLALLRARGSVTHTADGWVRRAIDELDVPSGIRDPVLERVSRLSDEARAVVEAAAVLQEPTPMSVLVAVSRVDDTDAVPGVEEALRSALLVEDGDAVGFRHVLAAQAVYDGLVGPRRQDLHSRAANALTTLDVVPLGQLAHHLRLAGRISAWAQAAEHAADQAIALNHDEEAARLLEDVVRHADLDVAHRARSAVKLGRAVVESLYPASRVIGPLSRLLEADVPLPASGELAFWLAMAVEKDGGDPARQRELYLRAVAGLDDKPGLKAWAMMGLAIAKAPGVALAEHKRWVGRVLDILPDVDDPTFEAQLLGKAAAVLAELGDPGWRQVSDRLVDLTGGTPRTRREVNAFCTTGLEACYLGHYAAATRLLEAAMAGAVRTDASQLQLRVRLASALLEYFNGGWDGLPEAVTTLLDELTEYPSMRIRAEVVTGCLAVACGDLDDAQSRLRAVLTRSAAMGEFDAYAIAVAALARLAVVRGDIDDAMVQVRQFMTDVERYELFVPMTRALPAVVELLVAAGNVPEARALIGRCELQWRGLDVPLAPAALRQADGVLNLAAEDRSLAAKQFAVASELYLLLACPYEAAQASEHAAMAMWDAKADGDDDAAELALTTALATYRRLGAGWDEARCRHLARAHGVRLPVPYRGGRKGYGDVLSPREAEIARLAATGLSNTEIAAEVFLSPRTVGTHMSRAMRKLGVRSRTALAARLAGGLSDDVEQG